MKDCFQRNSLQGTKLKYVVMQLNTWRRHEEGAKDPSPPECTLEVS